MTQRENSKILIVLLVVVILVVGWLLWRQKKVTYQPTSTPQPAVSDIQSDQDLQAASADLDSTDVDSSIDQSLSQNDQDTASF